MVVIMREACTGAVRQHPTARRRIAAMALLFGFASCGSQPIIKPDYRPVTTTPPRTAWTGPITLLADDQKFHIGNDAFLFRSGFVDRRFSASAVRVPQQDLFGDSLLGLAAMGPGIAAHLGDAMDLSCADEWRDFAKIMNDSGRDAWFWAPGNHDGFFFGNFVGPIEQWEKACQPSKPATKGDVLRAYLLEHLAGYAGVQLDPVGGTWSCPANTTCKGLRNAAWQIPSGAEYYRSYLIQEIDFPKGHEGAQPASLILIDTSSFDRPPRIAASEASFRYSAGEQGRLGADQLEVLKRWTARAVAEGRAVVIAGHHTFSNLEDVSRKAIDDLVRNRRVATYISGHTHWGQYFTHTSADGYAWLEPNLGSTIDYESEFGTLQLGFHEGKKFVRLPRTSMASFTTGKVGADLGIVCKDHWLARPDDQDFYTRYMTSGSPNPREVEMLYYSTMLAALDRYWRCVPSVPSALEMPTDCTPSPTECGEGSEVHAAITETLASQDLGKIRAKALELIELDQQRHVEPCLKRQYKVCQALWGAEYELRQYLTPVRGDDVFEIHTTRSSTAPSSAGSP